MTGLRAASTGYTLRWNALLGPLPCAEPAGLITTPNDNARRLDEPCVVGPLTVRPGERSFTEYRRLDPMTLDGWVEHRSWPVIVEGVQAAADEAAAVQEATRALHRLACVLALAWSEPWQVRTAPQDTHRLPARVPYSDPMPPDWLPALHMPEPVDVALPGWVAGSWDALAADEVLAAALTSWHEGILLQSTHPCMALVAYVGCIEQMAGSIWARGQLDRRGSASELSGGRFKPVAALAATQEELDLFDEMKVFRLRSKSAHGAPIVGIEVSYGATIPLSLVERPQPGGGTSVLVEIDTTDPGHALMIKLVPAARRVSARLLLAALGSS